LFSEDDLLPVSALQHLAFCERQWALIHLEGQWAENVLTVEGKHLHNRTHEQDMEVREGVRIVRGLRLRSLRLGLVGQVDVVEFHPCGAGEPGAELPGVKGSWRPFIVEYKRGRPKHGRWDEIQLCAQALCLEEMLQVEIQESALFYGQPRRRHVVYMDAALRKETEATAARLHVVYEAKRTPTASYSKKCDRCSLLAICLPKSTEGKSVERYLDTAFHGGQ